MKKILILFGAIVAYAANAQTTNWYVDGEIYQTTTCESGNSITPPSAPVKHGYTFVGWYDTSLVVGSGAQHGIPTPNNPIYPTFYQDGDLILRAVGSGTNMAADTYNAETGKIIRRVGVKVLDGTEGWQTGSFGGSPALYVPIPSTFNNMANLGSPYNRLLPLITSHFIRATCATTDAYWPNNVQGAIAVGGTFFAVKWANNDTAAVNNFKSWLAAQYAAGTPVTVYYPLATPIEETYTPAQ